MYGLKLLENGWRDILMNDITIPYFMTNEEWYYYDETEEIYKLTDKATEKAKESYSLYYSIKDDEIQ